MNYLSLCIIKTIYRLIEIYLISSRKSNIIRLQGDNMIKSTHVILNEYKEYSRPDCKLSNMVKEGKYYPIVKGLYETDPDTPGYFLAASIYGPSYLSFEFALAYYGLIPERVYTCTSATFEKRKQKNMKQILAAFCIKISHH